MTVAKPANAAKPTEITPTNRRDASSEGARATCDDTHAPATAAARHRIATINSGPELIAPQSSNVLSAPNWWAIAPAVIAATRPSQGLRMTQAPLEPLTG